MYKIVIADNDPVVFDTLGTLLRHKGCETICASDEVSVLHSLGPKRPDLILLGGSIPKTNGLTLLNHLTTLPELANTPMMMLTTAPHFKQLREEGLGKAVHLIPTPLIPEDAVTEVLYTLHEKRKREVKHALHIPESSASLLLFNLSQKNRKLLTSHLEKKGYFLEESISLEESLALLQRKYFPMIIIECNAEKKEGYLLASTIRAKEKEWHQRHILIGIGPDRTNDTAWISAGMNEYYKSPLSLKAIKIIMNQYKQLL